MSMPEWIASQHTFFVHLPAAVAVLLPIPLVSAQRMGRGIRPWWLMCRYLAIMGFLGLVLSMISGFASVPSAAPLKSLVTPAGRSTMTVSLVYHQLISTLSLILGVLTLMALFKKRKEHESLGWASLLLGLLWSIAILVSHHYGTGIARSGVEPPKPTLSSAPAPVVQHALRGRENPETALLVKLLDFQALSPIQPEAVRSKAHGDRWIRVWVSPEAVEGYRKGGPLPNGALVVMSSLEDHWGRPSTQPGPLYALENNQGAPSLALYWGKVPEEQRASFGGADRVFWRDSAPQLKDCQGCHAQGLAPLADRSRWVARSTGK